MASMCRYCNFRIAKFISPKIFSSYLKSSSPHIMQWYATMTTEASGRKNMPRKSSRSIHNKSDNENVDKGDVAFHGSIEDWWDTKGSMRGLHEMNEIRIDLIRNGLGTIGKLSPEDVTDNPEYLSGIKMLEVGCGGGILSEAIAKLGVELTAIDPGENVIKIAKTHATNTLKNVKHMPRYIPSTIEDYAVENTNVYDALITSEVIEHVPDKRIFLEACIKTVKPGGSIFITTPNRTLASWITVIVTGEDILKVLPKGLHQWDKFIMPDELKLLLEQLGCKTYSFTGMYYDFILNEWHKTETDLYFYGLHAVKLN